MRIRSTAFKHDSPFRLTLMVLALAVSGAAIAADYNENEPNNNVPPNFLPGNPLFLSGDRLVGSISTSSDTDDHFITVQGGGGPGIYRYTFDLNSNGGDSVLTVYDQANMYVLGYNDDRTSSNLSSLVVFDHFALDALNPVFGIGIQPFSGTFNYAMTVTRTTTPVDVVGTLGSGITTRSGTLANMAGGWHRFTLGTLSDITIDTAGSAETDTELVILNSSGQLLAANDDENFGAGVYTSRIDLSNLAAGTYYAVVGTFGSFYEYDLGAGAPINWDRRGFSGSMLDSNGNYNVRFNVNPVPEPGTMIALGLGVAALAARRRRRS